MIKKILVDYDVVLDVATGREPFVAYSSEALSLFETGCALGVMSSNSVTNIYYVLRKLGSDAQAREFLRTILQFMAVISVDHSNIMQALDSRFLDFEDGVQHFCAQKNQCDGILTRNIRDYMFSELAVMQPSEFVALYKG